MAIYEGIDFNKVENLTGRLSAMGLLGYDLDENHFFYRRLPTTGIWLYGKLLRPGPISPYYCIGGIYPLGGGMH